MSGHGPEDCRTCGGSGELLTEWETRQPGTTRPCPACGGSGQRASGEEPMTDGMPDEGEG